MELNEVYLVEANRTPQAKAGTELKDTPVPHLGIGLVRRLIANNNLPNDVIDEVIFGNTGAPAKYTNIGRIIALEAGLDKKLVGIRYIVIALQEWRLSLRAF